jgi:hypothetical protein
VLDIAIERLEFRRLDPFAVHAQAGVAFFLRPFRHFGVKALAALHQRNEHPQLLTARGAFQPRKNLRRRLADGHLVALGIARLPQLGVEQPDELKNLRDGRDGALAPAARDPLLDRHRGRDACDRVNVRPLKLLDELPRVSVQAVEIASLPLGEKQVEGERRFARAAQAGDDRHLVERDIEREIFQVVMTRPADLDRLRSVLEHRLFPAAVNRRFLAQAFRRGKLRQLGAQEFSRMTRLGRRHDLRCTRRHHATAFRFRLRPQVDQPVRAFQHVEIVLDHHQRIALVDESPQDAKQ